jgi:hypothetical protein
MEQRRLGRIGYLSSVVIFGGAMLADATQVAAAFSEPNGTRFELYTGS